MIPAIKKDANEPIQRTRRMRQRYLARRIKGKKVIINEICELWGYSQKHAIKMLHAKAGWGGSIEKVKNKGRCRTKPGGILKTQIPIPTDHSDVAEPGFLEADTVTHCGRSLEGDFTWSLTYILIFYYRV